MPGVPRGAQTLDQIHLGQQPDPESRVWPGGQEEVEPRRVDSHTIKYRTHIYSIHTYAHSAEILDHFWVFWVNHSSLCVFVSIV